MNAIEVLKVDIERAMPGVDVEIRRPRNADGNWWLDARFAEHLVTVQWSPRRGFGVSASDLAGYGEGADEVFEDRERAAQRVITLLRTQDKTIPPRDVLLRELRGLLRVTQDELAERLGVQQAAVSRLERRSDMTLGSLRRYVAALGGELEISVRTPGGEHVRLLAPEAPIRRASGAHVEQVLPEYDRRSSARMNLLVLRARDIERSRSFYALLGLQLVPERHGTGPLHYSCRMADTVMEIYPCTGAHARGGLRLGIQLPRASAAIERLVSSGFLAERPGVLRRQHGAEVYLVRDPDGNSIELELPAAA